MNSYTFDPSYEVDIEWLDSSNPAVVEIRCNGKVKQEKYFTPACRVLLAILLIERARPNPKFLSYEDLITQIFEKDNTPMGAQRKLHHLREYIRRIRKF